MLHFNFPLPNKDPRRQNKASVLLMPSRTEGFGLVGLEAIALGCPVLISEKSGLAELLQSTPGKDEANRLHVVPVSQDDDKNVQLYGVIVWISSYASEMMLSNGPIHCGINWLKSYLGKARLNPC